MSVYYKDAAKIFKFFSLCMLTKFTALSVAAMMWFRGCTYHRRVLRATSFAESRIHVRTVVNFIKPSFDPGNTRGVDRHKKFSIKHACFLIDVLLWIALKILVQGRWFTQWPRCNVINSNSAPLLEMRLFSDSVKLRENDGHDVSISRVSTSLFCPSVVIFRSNN